MLRLIGSLVLLFAAAAAGILWRRTECRRVHLVASSVALIRHARRKIDLFETPSSALFSDFEEGFDKEMRHALAQKNADEALADVIDFLGEDGAYLRKFLCEIGTGYKSDALRLCDYCAAALEERRTALEKEYQSRKKMHFALPLLSAISVIVMLL